MKNDDRIKEDKETKASTRKTRCRRGEGEGEELEDEKKEFRKWGRKKVRTKKQKIWGEWRCFQEEEERK